MAIRDIKKEVGGGIFIDSNESEANWYWNSRIVLPFSSLGVWACIVWNEYGTVLYYITPYHTFQQEAF